MTAEVAATAARALVSSGLLGPPAPAAVLRLIREVYRGGTNLYTLFAIAAARWPDRSAIIDDDCALSYRELQSKIESLAGELYRDELRRTTSGRHHVPQRTRLRRGGVRHRTGGCRHRAGEYRVSLRCARRCVEFAPSQALFCDNEFAERIRDASESVRIIDPATVQTQQGEPRPKVAPSGRIVLLTSGTTGIPKGVPRVPRWSSGIGVGVTLIERTQLRVGSRIAVAVPMFHGLGLGMLMLTVSLGGTVLTHRRFDAETTLAQASLQRADAMCVVPIMLARLLDLPDPVRARNPVPSLRAVISSGDRLDPSLGRRFMDAYGDILYNGYGSTEVGIGSLATPLELRHAPETVGRPVAGSPVRIYSRSGRPVGPRVTGRIFVGGELGAGYTGGDAKAVIDGFTSTGDMGYLDNSGRLYIVGREDDMIVSGGENVYPRALENALAEHAGIAETAVVGVPDEQFGRRLAAFIVLRSRSGLDEQAIREYLKGKVSRFEQPRDIRIVDSIPRNPAGKVLRKELAT